MSVKGYAEFLITKLKNERPDEYEEQKKLTLRFLDAVRTRLTAIETELYIEDSFVLLYEPGIFLLAFTNQYQYDTVKEQKLEKLTEITDVFTGGKASLFIMNDDGVVYDVKGKRDMSYDECLAERQSPAQYSIKARSDAAYLSEYTFDTFVVGAQNRFAHAGALAVAENPSFAAGGDKQIYNPLFIYGGSGLGKTHLLYAIMNRISEKFPEAKIIYIKGDEFTNELILAIRNQEQLKFRNKYRYADVLLVDDIQFIAGKDMTQEEFFHTFNTLFEAKKQIILTSDRPAKDIALLEERLESRFMIGLTADIQPPDYETRMAIISSKAETFGVEIPKDVMSFVANNVSKNIRQIEGAVKKIKAYQSLTGEPVTIQNITNILSDILDQTKNAPITIDDIIKAVTEFYSISEEDMQGVSRKANIVFARQLVMYLARRLTDMTFEQIGDVLGKNHSTVVYSISKIEEEIRLNARQKKIVEDIIKNLTEK
ncbi:MAG: chromosomal replication initiator protein DnaA [Clostridia bacterium]|nr:chromosomal replication initiator protein DnaA [Clostridia bacterium]